MNQLLKVILAVCIAASIGCKQDKIDSNCVAEAFGSYPEQDKSEYVLPWQVGESYKVGQGNCTNFSHRDGTPDKFAYDFLMPVGTYIVAARSGKIVHVEERFVDGEKDGENAIYIEHENGEASAYIHLTHMGSLVEIGQLVEQGEIIGMSGNTGRSTAPHLHFAVISCYCETAKGVAVNFKNTEEHIDGLKEGKFYSAY